jgi:hypothetical protein
MHTIATKPKKKVQYDYNLTLIDVVNGGQVMNIRFLPINIFIAAPLIIVVVHLIKIMDRHLTNEIVYLRNSGQHFYE